MGRAQGRARTVARRSTPASTARIPSSRQILRDRRSTRTRRATARRPSTRTATARTSRRWPARRRQRHRHRRRGLRLRAASSSKTDLTDASIAALDRRAADRGADAINMSFGTDGDRAARRDVVDAIDYAYAQRRRPRGGRGRRPGPRSRATRPTSCSRPAAAPDIDAGKGLTVTAATPTTRRAPFAGRGTQISIAAYGAVRPRAARTGLLGAFPCATDGARSAAAPTDRPARRALPRRASTATPATPTCRARRWPRRRSRRSPRSCATSTPT